jgi:hypothetical protein
LDSIYWIENEEYIKGKEIIESLKYIKVKVNFGKKILIWYYNN